MKDSINQTYSHDLFFLVKSYKIHPDHKCLSRHEKKNNVIAKIIKFTVNKNSNKYNTFFSSSFHQLP